MKNYEYYLTNEDRFKELYDALKNGLLYLDTAKDFGIKLKSATSVEQDLLSWLIEEREITLELIDANYLITTISQPYNLPLTKVIEILKEIFTLKPHVYNPITNRYGYEKKEVMYILEYYCNSKELEEILYFANNYDATHIITIRSSNNGNRKDNTTNS